MRSLFDFDNPFIQLLCRLGDLMIANFLFCVCCLPVVTIGASLAGLIKVVQSISLGGEPGVLMTFFKGFRENFRQATAAWLVLAVLAASLVCDLLLVRSFLSGTAAVAVRCLVWVVAAAALATASYLFPLIVRYENTLREHCVNALILTVLKLPRTAAMMVLNAVPFLLAYFVPATFIKTLAVWLIVGFAGLCYLDCSLLRPVLAQLEKAKDPPEADASDGE